jgi:hypothetical protein
MRVNFGMEIRLVFKHKLLSFGLPLSQNVVQTSINSLLFSLMSLSRNFRYLPEVLLLLFLLKRLTHG